VSERNDLNVSISNAEILSKTSFINLEAIYTKSIGDMTDDEYMRFESSLSKKAVMFLGKVNRFSATKITGDKIILDQISKKGYFEITFSIYGFGDDAVGCRAVAYDNETLENMRRFYNDLLSHPEDQYFKIKAFVKDVNQGMILNEINLDFCNFIL
jgi:hypothetical protein